MPPDTPIQSFGSFINSIYEYSLQIVGLCVFAMFIYAGFQFMFGNAAAGRKIIQDAVVGTILLFSAYVILNSINPDLVGQEAPVIPALRSGSGSQ
jgi:cell shape-determining protein MreD